MKKDIQAEIIDKLFELRDKKYRDVQSALIPTVEQGSAIGVRTPALRKYAAELSKREDVGEFLSALPHQYFDENQLHAFVIASIKDFDSCIGQVEIFLPYIDNWATCDQMGPKVFKKHHKELFSYIKKWIESDHVYTKRFAIKMLMDHFLEEDYDEAYPKMVAKIRSDEYYVNMMIAWYFATALAKQYESILPFIESESLGTWTHNKTIQKAIESYRITPEQKDYLKTLKK